MRINRLCLINIAAGLLAGAGAFWVRLPEKRAVLDGSVPPDRLIEPFFIALLIIGMGGAILATAHLGLALRKARARASTLILRAPGEPRSASEWDGVLKSKSAPSGGQDRDPPPGTSLQESKRRLLAPAPRLARTELLSLYWWYIRRMRVWTAIALTVLGAISAAASSWLLPDRAVSLSILRTIGPGLIATLLLLALMRILIAGRIDRFIEASSGAASPTIDQSKSGRSFHRAVVLEQRATPSPAEYPSVSLPVRAEPAVPERGGGSSATSPRLEPTSAITAEHSDESHTDSSEEAPPAPDGKTPAGTEERFNEYLYVIANIGAQHDTMMESILALRGPLLSIVEQMSDRAQHADTASGLSSNLNRLAEKIIDRALLVEKKLSEQIATLAKEIRQRDDAQAVKFGELYAALIRLETRVLPALRQVSTNRRAMALLAERLNQVDRHLEELRAMRSSASLNQSPAEVAAEPSATETKQEHDIAEELRRLMLELEGATGDAPDKTNG